MRRKLRSPFLIFCLEKTSFSGYLISRMNKTITQIYSDYRDELNAMMKQYQDSLVLFEDNSELEAFISRAENLKTLVALFADLARARKKKLI